MTFLLQSVEVPPSPSHGGRQTEQSVRNQRLRAGQPEGYPIRSAIQTQQDARNARIAAFRPQSIKRRWVLTPSAGIERHGRIVAEGGTRVKPWKLFGGRCVLRRNLHTRRIRSAASRPKLSFSPSALRVCSGPHTGNFPCAHDERRLSAPENAYFRPKADNHWQPRHL